MARKFCPACNRLCGGSATDCPCGHVFDASTIVVAKPPKVCLLCGDDNPADAASCHCGLDFGVSVEEVRLVLRGRRTNGAIMTGLGVSGLVTLGVVAWMGGVFWPSLFVLAGVLLAFGLRSLVGSMRLLRALPSLPRATLRVPPDSK